MKEFPDWTYGLQEENKEVYYFLFVTFSNDELKFISK
jgi:hypothetical protein